MAARVGRAQRTDYSALATAAREGGQKALLHRVCIEMKDEAVGCGKVAVD